MEHRRVYVCVSNFINPYVLELTEGEKGHKTKVMNCMVG